MDGEDVIINVISNFAAAHSKFGIILTFLTSQFKCSHCFTYLALKAHVISGKPMNKMLPKLALIVIY